MAGRSGREGEGAVVLVVVGSGERAGALASEPEAAGLRVAVLDAADAEPPVVAGAATELISELFG